VARPLSHRYSRSISILAMSLWSRATALCRTLSGPAQRYPFLVTIFCLYPRSVICTGMYCKVSYNPRNFRYRGGNAWLDITRRGTSSGRFPTPCSPGIFKQKIYSEIWTFPRLRKLSRTSCSTRSWLCLTSSEQDRCEVLQRP
jgi:hypothetical protein